MFKLIVPPNSTNPFMRDTLTAPPPGSYFEALIEYCSSLDTLVRHAAIQNVIYSCFIVPKRKKTEVVMALLLEQLSTKMPDNIITELLINVLLKENINFDASLGFKKIQLPGQKSSTANVYFYEEYGLIKQLNTNRSNPFAFMALELLSRLKQKFFTSKFSKTKFYDVIRDSLPKTVVVALKPVDPNLSRNEMVLIRKFEYLFLADAEISFPTAPSLLPLNVTDYSTALVNMALGICFLADFRTTEILKRLSPLDQMRRRIFLREANFEAVMYQAIRAVLNVKGELAFQTFFCFLIYINDLRLMRVFDDICFVKFGVNPYDIVDCSVSSLKLLEQPLYLAIMLGSFDIIEYISNGRPTSPVVTTFWKTKILNELASVNQDFFIWSLDDETLRKTTEIVKNM